MFVCLNYYFEFVKCVANYKTVAYAFVAATSKNWSFDFNQFVVVFVDCDVYAGIKIKQVFRLQILFASNFYNGFQGFH